jgi:hypothetical protein
MQAFNRTEITGEIPTNTDKQRTAAIIAGVFPVNPAVNTSSNVYHVTAFGYLVQLIPLIFNNFI